MKRLFFKANLKDPNDVIVQGRKTVPEKDANLVSSLVSGSDLGYGKGRHAPVLDIDFGAQLVESTTPGHYHLYLDHSMSWDDYVFLLRALVAVGIIERGFYEMSVKRGATFVRKPGVKKEEGDINSAGGGW